MNATEQYDDSASRGWFAKVRDKLWGPEEGEFDEEPLPGQEVRRKNLRLDHARSVAVSVHMSATGFNEARAAADGLKEGKQQIVNLERATTEMAERILDFLSGVTYALDGSVEKVGEKVYMFAPANVQVELGGGANPPR
jgi:cell division inhibitor SepF